MKFIGFGVGLVRNFSSSRVFDASTVQFIYIYIYIYIYTLCLNFICLRNTEIFREDQEKFRKFESDTKKLSVNYVTSSQSFTKRNV